jgi:hypothetical protein
MMKNMKVLFAAALCLLVSTALIAEPFDTPPEGNHPNWKTPFPYQRNAKWDLKGSNPTTDPPIYEGTDDVALFGSDFVTIDGDVVWVPGSGVGIVDPLGGSGSIIFHFDNWERDIPWIKHIWKEFYWNKTPGALIEEVLVYPDTTAGGYNYRHWGAMFGENLGASPGQTWWYNIKPNPLWEEIHFVFTVPPGELALLEMVHIATECVLDCYKEGDPGLYRHFNTPEGDNVVEVVKGESICWLLGPANFGFQGYCPAPDTFCMHITEQQGWVSLIAPPIDEAHLLDPGYLWWQDLCIEVPCEAIVCTYDTIIAQMAYVYWCGDTIMGGDPLFFCATECIDSCMDPNIHYGDPKPQIDTIILHVMESPPALNILQPDTTLVGEGQTAAYIPFQVCNDDFCAPPTDYGYRITSQGSANITPITMTDTVSVPGGECLDVYGILDAGAAIDCEYDTLTIIAWTLDPIPYYDTCGQVIHVIGGVVPLFSMPVVTILVLAMILAAAVIMRRRAASKA